MFIREVDLEKLYENVNEHFETITGEMINQNSSSNR